MKLKHLDLPLLTDLMIMGFVNQLIPSYKGVFMNNIIKGNWRQLKGKLRAKWGKITGHDLTELKGNTQELGGKIQKAYSQTEKNVEKES